MKKTVSRALIGDNLAVRERADGSLPSTKAVHLLCQEPRRESWQAIRTPTEPIQTSFSHMKGQGFLFDKETTTKAGARSHLGGSQVGPQLQFLPAPGHHLCEIQLLGTLQPSLCNLRCMGALGTAGSKGVQTASFNRLLTGRVL